MLRPWSCRQKEAAGQPIEPCPAKHLTLQHLQAMDLAFDRSLAPWQRDRRLASSDGRLEPSGEAPEGWEGARGGARQPRFKMCGLTLADQAGEVLCERHRLCQLGRLLGQLCQLVASVIRGAC
jgi:hypothetical protein